MNCFEWRNIASDYLDGTLVGATERDADAHVKGCRECTERSKHYRLIVTTIASQARTPLPVPIRKSPVATLQSLGAFGLSRWRWEQAPWYVRTTLEGTSIVLLILLGISMGPKVRALYERNIDRNFSEFTESLTSSDGSFTPAGFNVPLSRGRPVAAVDPSSTQLEDEFATEGSEEDDGDSVTDGSGASAGESEGAEIRVGNSEIWRFNFKTDSPHEFRAKIVEVLSELKVPADTPGVGGVEAPGGIQFSMLLPQSYVAPLKRHLEKLAPPTPEGLNGSPVGETFTWYKNKSKSKTPIPNGYTQVVIWLSQL